MKTIRLLFSDDMARAIVEGRKTVTRRPAMGLHGCAVNPALDLGGVAASTGIAFFDMFGRTHEYARTPCTPGDLLIGRECWAAIRDDDEEWNESTPNGGRVEYRADHDPPLRKPFGWDYAEPGDAEMVHWRPSIHMPDWAARIRRRVLSVTVERVQDITEEDAVREGFSVGVVDNYSTSARDEFSAAWESIYAAKGLGWSVNPWVWRIEFGAENVEATP